MPSGAKNLGQRTPKIATSITQVISKAPIRVNNPSSTRIPPISSDTAAPPIHSHAGRMNGNGAGLYTAYLLPFEIASILLLVAIVGAVVLSKKRTPVE